MLWSLPGQMIVTMQIHNITTYQVQLVMSSLEPEMIENCCFPLKLQVRSSS